MRYIKRNEDIVKSKNGEFQYKNKVIPNSSIKKLIFHATSDDQTKPHGMKLFYQALSYANVPTFLIVNKIGKSIMKKTKNKRGTRNFGEKKLIKVETYFNSIHFKIRFSQDE